MQSYLGIGETFNFQEVEVKGEKEFYISGYISTKSIDKFNDVITDECLDDMLVQVKSGSIKIDFEHETIHNDNLDINPVARIVDAKKDHKGLWVKALVNSAHKRFAEIKGSIVKGFLDSFSIAFKPIETATRYIQGKAVRILNKLKLINVGITGTPVNDECKLDNVITKALMEFDVEDEEIEDDEEFTPLDELDETELKHKYIKRTGSQGNYKYFYRDGQKPSKDGRIHSDEAEEKIQAMHQKWADEVRQIKEKEAGGEITKEESKKKIAQLTENYKKESDKVELDDKEKPKEINSVEQSFKDNKNPYKEGSQASEDWKKGKQNRDKMASAKTRKEKMQVFIEASYSGEGMKDVLKDNFGKEKLSELSEEELEEYLKLHNETEFLKSIEKKALTTQSGLSIGNITNHTSQSSGKTEDNRQMENETKPVEQATETEAIAEPAKVEEATDEVKEVENTEVSELKEELAEVKAQLVKVQQQLAKPEMKAIQEAMPTTKQKDNVTPLGLIG